jgi:methionyl-tRNA synthetase
MSRFYVTTPIYYVNALPHIGHIFSTVVADTVARYRRMAGDDVRFLTGTDEHGLKIERAAAARGITPIALADEVVARYRALWTRFGMTNDDFIRTTEPRHERGVVELIRRLEASGDLYTARHEGWYCVACESFYTEKELLQPGNRCPDHETPTEWSAEENVYFRLSKYERPLLEWMDAHPEFIQPEARRNEMRAFVEQGLKDLSVSRANVDWGIPFPHRPGQTVYVWLDALSNYINALGFGAPVGEDALYRRYWLEGDARVHLVGKDIARFHTVYWPAFLMAADLPLPTTVWVHGWWLRDQKKMSKSVGNVVRPDHLIERFGPDALRYFLLREMVFGQDASFSDEGFVDRFNADLANDLGNTTSRLVTLSRQAYGGKTPPTPCDDNPILALSRDVLPEYRSAMERFAFQEALRALWRLLAETNQYLVAREPWKKIKTEGPSEALSRVLWNGLEAVRLVATGLLPVMPETAARILAAIGVAEPPRSLAALAWGGLPTSVELPAPAPIFPRIDKEKYMSEIAPPAATEPANLEGTANLIDIAQFGTVELKVGNVLACEAIPKSEKLLKLRVDLGEPGGPRQVLAGIAKVYTPEELVGTQVVIVANLKPAKLMGQESQGMVLAATDPEGRPILLRPHAAGAAPGARVK